YHIVSGQSFFSGVALLFVAALSSTRTKPIFRRVTVLSFLIGAIAVVVSSTALPYWYYAVAVTVTLIWIVSGFKKELRRNAAFAMAGIWLIAALFELPHHITYSLEPAKTRTLTVIGDSVTAGVDGDETSETWPRLLARQHQVEVQDISHIGETAASALKRVQSQSIESSVVVVEIGGNDILGSTTRAEFAQDLDALLVFLESTDRQVIMFELPLPPLYHEFGRIQRTAAAKHNVTLVPKRVFLSVIAGSESTLDSIHLSQSGHQSMADKVWCLVEDAFVDRE
ncbi:MAG: acyl-CoA thioesterase, partial [Planctomycetaceae bacterium]|nr:acyl-CoA thioesterase [Planctomycetaceae bacterium]